MAPAVLQLMEIKPPAELAAALSADFLDPLGIANPPPVRIAIPPEAAAWGGYCSGTEYAERGEVVIADWRITQEWLVQQRIQAIYVHEVAHRLLSQAREIESHGIEFFTLQLFLFRRAGLKKGDRPWILDADLYDCQDCLDSRDIPGVPSLGKSIAFAMELASALAPKEITAEQAAQEICHRARAWREEIAATPGRREAAQKTAREKFEALQAALQSARDKIFWWKYAVVVAAGVGFLAGAIFF